MEHVPDSPFGRSKGSILSWTELNLVFGYTPTQSFVDLFPCVYWYAVLKYTVGSNVRVSSSKRNPAGRHFGLEIDFAV